MSAKADDEAAQDRSPGGEVETVTRLAAHKIARSDFGRRGSAGPVRGEAHDGPSNAAMLSLQIE
jgi:hypothetical protein